MFKGNTSSQWNLSFSNLVRVSTSATMSNRILSTVFVFSVLLCFSLQSVGASGTFELQVLGVQNYRGELLDGRCCGGVQRKPLDGSFGRYRASTGHCTHSCNTYFRLCLKEYQSVVTSGGSCTFGSTTSPVLGRNLFTFPTDPDSGSIIRLPFDFRWTVSTFYIIFFINIHKDGILRLIAYRIQ